MSENKILKQYKRDLDLDLMRFDDYNSLMENIIVNDTIGIELSIQSILHTCNHRDLLRSDSDFKALDLFLNPDQINGLNSYGTRKLSEIEKTFNINSEKIIKTFDDKALNKTIHELCFQRWVYENHMCPIPLTITKQQPAGFIQLLVETFRKLIQDYHTNFNKMLLVSSSKTPIKQTFSSENANLVAENPYPIQFKNIYAYKMFLELKDLTVNKRTVTADYSFIYHKMKDKKLNAINNGMTEPSFIEFLNENFNAEISGLKLPFRNPTNKQKIFTTILNKYQHDILR